MRLRALFLALGMGALTSACVFTDLADLPPPITIQNNNTIDVEVDSPDMALDVPANCPKREFLTTNGVAHLGLDQTGDVVLYAARLSGGGIQRGRLEGTTHDVLPIVNLPADNIHALEVAALGPASMVIAVLQGEDRTLRLYNCTNASCVSFVLSDAFTDTQRILEVSLGKDPISVGVVREMSPKDQFSAHLLELTATPPTVKGVILGLNDRQNDVAGARHIGLGEARYRVVGGDVGSGYFVGEGATPITTTRCGDFDRIGILPYFTRIKPSGSKFLLRTRDLLLTDCINTTTLSRGTGVSGFVNDADYLHIGDDDYFALWSSKQGVEGAFVSGEEATTLQFSESDVLHDTRVARIGNEFLVFTGGLNTNLSVVRGTKEELIRCF